MPSRASLTWVHVSDLHFGHGDPHYRFDQVGVTDAIVRNAAEMVTRLGSPDLIFLTGDVAFSGQPAQYAQAAEFLSRLRRVVGGSPRLFVVPGNHDVDRKLAAKLSSGSLHEKLRSTPRMLDDLLADAAEMQTIWPKLREYAEFSKNFDHPALTAESPFYSHEVPSRFGGKLVVVGLNTALLCHNEGDSPQNLSLGRGQLLRAIEQQPRDALLLVLQHHPNDWLLDGKDLTAYLQQRAHIQFSGHVHQQQGVVHVPVLGGSRLHFVAGAGHKDRQEEGHHSYAWGQLTEEGLAYYSWVWLPDRKGFALAAMLESDDFKAGDHAFVERARLPKLLRNWLARSSPPTTAGVPPPTNIDAVPVTAISQEDASVLTERDRMDRGDQLSKKEIAQLKSANKIFRILIFTASPISLPRLRLNEEVRQIRERIRQSSHSVQFEIHYLGACQLSDLQQALLTLRPSYIHFCGLDKVDPPSLVMENESRQPQYLSMRDFSELLSFYDGQVESIFLNTCNLGEFGETIGKYAKYVIGWDGWVDDASCRLFAGEFYSSLALSLSVEGSFSRASMSLKYQITSQCKPVLYSNRRLLFQESPQSDTVATSADKKRILIFSALPKDVSQIDIDNEVRKIWVGLHEGGQGNRFLMSYCPAIRHKDIAREIRVFHPAIVHFSCHGSADGDLILEDEDGEPQCIRPELLARTFKPVSNGIECIILMSLGSEQAAALLAGQVPFVVGIHKSISDRVAIEFSTEFYAAIGGGASVEEAFESAQTHVSARELTRVENIRLFRHKTGRPKRRAVTSAAIKPQKETNSSKSDHRRLMEKLLTLDEDIEAFCIDHFPHIKKKFTGTMTTTQKKNLILELADPTELADKLRLVAQSPLTGAKPE